MIMNTKLLSVVAVAALLFASCSNENEVPEINDGRVNFSSGITLSATTRVITNVSGGSTWETNDEIGIYMVNNGTSEVVENAENIPYKAALRLQETSFNAKETIIYYPVNVPEKVDFRAYYPYKNSIVDWVYPVDVSDQTSLDKIDLMYVQTDNSGEGYDKTSPNVNLEFSHQLTKIVISVGVPSAVNGSLESVKIEGMPTTANFDLKGEEGLTNIDNVLTIELNKREGIDNHYEAILFPIAELNENHKVVFTTTTGEKYIWNMSEQITKMEAGYYYPYSITLTKHKVGAIGSIKEWESRNQESGIAE